ncbi:MAG: stage III sporulation protein AF [Eubacteriales bacterium]
METLRVMVKSVIVIIIMAAFLEIILPRSSIKRYINLIIGLFVIIAVLNPFLAVVHKGFSFDILENTDSRSEQDTGALIQKGRDIAAGQKAGVARQYKEKLAKQILSLANVSNDGFISGVDIDMVDDAANPNFGRINRIVLHTGSPGAGGPAGTGEKKAPAVRDVSVNEITIKSAGVGENRPGQPKNDGETRGLREMIAGFYGLSLEQIEIQK